MRLTFTYILSKSKRFRSPRPLASIPTLCSMWSVIKKKGFMGFFDDLWKEGFSTPDWLHYLYSLSFAFLYVCWVWAPPLWSMSHAVIKGCSQDCVFPKGKIEVWHLYIAVAPRSQSVPFFKVRTILYTPFPSCFDNYSNLLEKSTDDRRVCNRKLVLPSFSCGLQYNFMYVFHIYVISFDQNHFTFPHSSLSLVCPFPFSW